MNDDYFGTQVSKTDPFVKKILAHTFPNYRGRKIRLRTGVKTFAFDDANWSGGSRTVYKLINSQTWETMRIDSSQAPWSPYMAQARESRPLPPNAVVVEHIMFQGKDCGIRINVAEGTALPA
jgi:hypothetical protein